MSKFFAFFTQLVVLVFSIPGLSLGQSFYSEVASTTTGQLSPELENTVRNTLKQSSLTLQLIENNGQCGLPASVVAYFSSGNQTVFIEKDRLRIVVVKAADEGKNSTSGIDKSSITAKSKDFRYNTFNIVFKGSTGFTSCQKIRAFQTRRNFMQVRSPEHDVTNVGSYGEIVLKNIYQGIDLRLYSEETGQLEFDWIVAPRVDPGVIKMRLEGPRSVLINNRGDLQIMLGIGSFNVHLPESYYVTPAGKEPADIQFHLSGKNEIAFKGFANKPGKYPLVIDPDLLWGTFFDGGNFNFDEYLYAIDFNNNNNLLYCAGAASRQVSTSYAAALSHSYDSTFEAIPDALIYALTKDGQTVQYITYLGGAGADVGIGISVNQSFAFVSGYTTSPDFPVTKGASGDVAAFDTVYHGNDEGFVAIFNLTLDGLVYSSYLGGAGNDKALTIRAVSDSSYYVSLACGDTLSQSGTDYLVAAADNTFGGSADGWIGEFTSMNQLRFGTYIGGNSSDLVNDFQVLSDGDVVFVGNTFGITEINASVPNNAFGREVLFGRINVPASGPVSFGLIEKIGGNGDDYGWGITTLGDSVSVLVGQTTSSDFPLGGGAPFQTVNRGSTDGFIARINNDGSGGYVASFVGGSDEDILVSVRPVIVKNLPVLLAFGTTRSNDLSATNHTGGAFYSSSNSGGYDMMWLICDLNVTFKYYLSYIGGTNNDYLGQTGAPIGSNHLFFNATDSVIYLGTTTHSYEVTQAPSFVGRGPTDLLNAGVPVFDSTKDNTNNDTHVIIAISVRMLFYTLPINWEKFDASVLSDCSVELTWRTGGETTIKQYAVQRSADGRTYQTIAIITGGGVSFSYLDKSPGPGASRLSYRIVATGTDGAMAYSSVNALQSCGQKQPPAIRIYPTLVNNYFVISGAYPAGAKPLMVEVIDAGGRKIMLRQLNNVNGAQTLYFEKRPAPGTYFVSVVDQDTKAILESQKIIVGL